MSGVLSPRSRVGRIAAACRDAPVSIQLARFCGVEGVTETHLVAQPTAYASFAEQLDWLRRASEEAADLAGVPLENAVFRRFFCSDIANQVGNRNDDELLSGWPSSGAGAVSWIGQPPPAPAKIAMWAYFVADPVGELLWDGSQGRPGLRRGALRHHWSCGLPAPHADGAAAPNTSDQTAAIFDAYEADLRAGGMTLASNVVRTWFFLRDIDADYGELVSARRRHFAQQGLTPQTHYIASTGIGGTGRRPDGRVTLDAYAIAGLHPEQVEYLRAPEHLSRTDAYGVTFERGTAIAYRDRRHVLISGTASIDCAGNLLHPGDVARQLERTLDNITALLDAASAGPDDLCQLIAYVRDASDEALVRAGIYERCGDVPLLVVEGAVCRPGWLVEIEGQAILAHDAPEQPPF